MNTYDETFFSVQLFRCLAMIMLKSSQKWKIFDIISRATRQQQPKKNNFNFHHKCSLPNPTPELLISKNIFIFWFWTPNIYITQNSTGKVQRQLRYTCERNYLMDFFFFRNDNALIIMLSLLWKKSFSTFCLISSVFFCIHEQSKF